MRDATPREAMALKATVEPTLMRDKRMVMTKETRTEFKGIFQPGLTYKIATRISSRILPTFHPVEERDCLHETGTRRTEDLGRERKHTSGVRLLQHC